MSDALSLITKNRIQKNTYKSNYITETMSEIYGTDELPEGMFPIKFNIIDQYQRNHPVLTAKMATGKYKGD